MGNLDVFLFACGTLLILGVLFELYGHYAYVHTKGATVIRVDRLTGDSCTLPCNGSEAESFVVAPPPDTPAPKTCHPANVVRVSAKMRFPADRKPIAYGAGGVEAGSTASKSMRRRIVPFASELSDGHVYAFSRLSYEAVATWSTGQDVEVCATWSKIERRPYYSIGAGDDTEPADIAI